MRSFLFSTTTVALVLAACSGEPLTALPSDAGVEPMTTAAEAGRPIASAMGRPRAALRRFADSTRLAVSSTGWPWSMTPTAWSAAASSRCRSTRSQTLPAYPFTAMRLAAVAGVTADPRVTG